MAINPDLFLSALEDGAIKLARELLSIHGAAIFFGLSICACWCTDNAKTALWYGISLWVFVGLILLLNYFVFPPPPALIPIRIDNNTIWFPTPPRNGTGPNVTNATTEEPFKREVQHEIQKADHALETGWNDVSTLLGFGLVPIVMITGFGSVMYFFRIDSGLAKISTIILVILVCITSFKVMVMDKSSYFNPAAAAPDIGTNGTNGSQAIYLQSVGRASVQLGALARLRGVETQLDSLLVRVS